MAGDGGAGGDGTLREVEDRFLSCWGEIAALWGVNRTLGRMHALLFLSAEPLDAETLTKRLAISHGNCSTSLHSLLGWGVIRRVHLPGERRAFYEAEPDAWTWFHTCVRERRRREIDPVIESLHGVRAFAEAAAREAPAPERRELEAARDRVADFVKFMDEFTDLIDAFLALGEGPMGRVLRKVGTAAARKRRRR